jgi:hypothetical protein
LKRLGRRIVQRSRRIGSLRGWGFVGSSGNGIDPRLV